MRYLDEESGEPIVAAPYEIHRQGGAVLSGQLDAQGRAEHHNLDDKPVVKVIYKPRPPAQERPHPPLRG